MLIYAYQSSIIFQYNWRMLIFWKGLWYIYNINFSSIFLCRLIYYMLNILKLSFIQTFLVLFSLLYQSLSCPAYCFSCYSYNVCDVCITGYGVYNSYFTIGWANYYQRICLPCSDANCYQCSTFDSCIKCKDGYRITSSGGLNVC